MRRTHLLHRSAALAAVLALTAVAAEASHRGDRDRSPRPDRMLVATTDQNQLIRFNARNPERLRDIRAISGLPPGVTLKGIDFRPATGDLYGVGSDSVVYRVNPATGIAVAEAPAFTPLLRGRSFGVDFNPVPDKIRVVSDDLFKQDPPNDGTLKEGKRLGIDVGMSVGFDIAGAENTGYLANSSARRGATLYTVDVASGDTDALGRIGGGRRLVVTGLAAWQD